MRVVGIRRLGWRLLVPAVGLAAAAQLGLAGAASATHIQAGGGHASASTVYKVNWQKPNMLDCNGWGQHNGRDVTSVRPAMKGLCTDPIQIKNGKATRFLDNGWYVGHDEPSVKFISSAPGSGNTMAYGLKLPRDPTKTPTANGSVTKYGELSVAPWFGLPICDHLSYPQNPCKPLSDTNSGSITNPKDAGSAFLELQFYPPGFTPFEDSTSCSRTQWCAALTIDSLECSFNFATCNGACIEPVNFAFLQMNGVPTGPPSPQKADLATFTPNAHTLKMNPGDVLTAAITNVRDYGTPDAGGLKATVTDLTTHQVGHIVASAKNGFADTSLSNCTGHPFSFHAEYNTARKKNQVPWAALEGGVLMEQEVGHFESCTSLSYKMGVSAPGYTDPNVYQTCNGGREGAKVTGEGPCNLNTFTCKHATAQGVNGPVKCSTNSAVTGALCEFADGFCMPKGSRPVTINGKAAKESWAVTGCTQNFAQNGDLDYDGNTYHADWPNGTANYPTPMRFVGPVTRNNTPYPYIQFETDAAGSEGLCNVSTGVNCTAPPLGAKFYPFWSMNNTQTLAGLTKKGTCVWNFGNYIKGVTKVAFSRDKQYGKPDVARYGGTITSPVRKNPELLNGC